MAMRGGPTRRVVGNPLAGVLGHLDQRARIGGRTRTSSAPREEDPVPRVTTPVVVAEVPAGVVLTTGEDGRARWVFPTPYGVAPAVTATAVDPDPGDGERTVWAVLEEATGRQVTVRVWRSRGRRGTGVAEPAGSGFCVHVVAVVAVPSSHG